MKPARDHPVPATLGHGPTVPDGTVLERLEAKFPTGALATLELARWSSLSPSEAQLVPYVVPKQLR